jgi:hypothetical protein
VPHFLKAAQARVLTGFKPIAGKNVRAVYRDTLSFNSRWRLWPGRQTAGESALN